jgi:hypothetical protein
VVRIKFSQNSITKKCSRLEQPILLGSFWGDFKFCFLCKVSLTLFQRLI